MTARTQQVLIVLALSTSFAVAAYSCNRRWTEESRATDRAHERELKGPCQDCARHIQPLDDDTHMCPRPDQKLTIEGGWIRCRCKDK